MPLKITSAQRAQSAPCDHWTLTIDDGTRTYTVRTSGDEITNWIEAHLGDASPAVVTAMIWAAYKRKVVGASLASLINVEIA